MLWHFPKMKGIYLPKRIFLFGEKTKWIKMYLLKYRQPNVSVMDFNCQRNKTNPMRVQESDKAETLKIWHVSQNESPLLPRTKESESAPSFLFSLPHPLLQLSELLPLCCALAFFSHCQIAFLHRSSEQFHCLQGTPFAYQIKLRLLGLAVKALYHLHLAHISSLVYLCLLLQTNEPVPRECPVLSQLSLPPPIATCWNFPTLSCHVLHEAFPALPPPVFISPSTDHKEHFHTLFFFLALISTI